MDSPGRSAKSRYPGEDARLTSRKELWGWLSYGWAAEVFVVCGVGSFIPITLEQLARERGVLLSDRTTPCRAILDVTPPPNLNSTTPATPTADPSHVASGQCIISLLGMDINTASFAMYTFSFSVLIQALLIISMSGAADHGRYRKSLLLGFAFTGALATMLFLPITPRVYFIGAILAIVANTCFGASFVLLNSFLPLLVRHHPSVQSQPRFEPPTFEVSDDTQGSMSVEDDIGANEITDPTSALLPTNEFDLTLSSLNPLAASSPELRLSTEISSQGIGIGYIAAIIVQILSVPIVISSKGSTFSLRLVLFFIGAWWAVFSIPAAMWLRPRPGPPLHSDTDHASKRTWLAYMAFSWKSLGKTVLRARRLKDVILFLAAWFLLSDGIATVSGTAVLFAKTSLGMEPAALALINVVVMAFGVIGAFTWDRASRMMSLKPIQTILACLCVFETIPLYALLGYIPAIRRLGTFGLQQPWEMYLLGAVYGIVLGGISSYCRALYGELIPPGFEAAFYALYAITDKGSSIFGPAVVGAITDVTGDIRPAFWFLAVLIGLPFPLMYFVDVDRGKRDGAAMARELEGRNVLRTGIDMQLHDSA